MPEIVLYSKHDIPSIQKLIPELKNQSFDLVQLFFGCTNRIVKTVKMTLEYSSSTVKTTMIYYGSDFNPFSLIGIVPYSDNYGGLTRCINKMVLKKQLVDYSYTYNSSIRQIELSYTENLSLLDDEFPYFGNPCSITLYVTLDSVNFRRAFVSTPTGILLPEFAEKNGHVMTPFKDNIEKEYICGLHSTDVIQDELLMNIIMHDNYYPVVFKYTDSYVEGTLGNPLTEDTLNYFKEFVDFFPIHVSVESNSIRLDIENNL